jgi:hypothetical protein
MSSSRSILDHVTALADAALDHPPGSALVCEAGRSPVALPATAHRYGALVGLSCPASIGAVAANHEAILSIDGTRHEVTLGVAVSRSGPCVARFRRGCDRPQTLDRLVGPLVDVGRRALRLATPPSSRAPLDLIDAAFIDSVLTGLLDADLGTKRPSWCEISATHPLADSLAVTPLELRRRRWALHPIGWSTVRQRLLRCGGGGDFELTPAVAGWLDDGSLARWLLARYPEPAQILADVCELLDPPTAAAMATAHTPWPGRSRPR